MLTTVENPFLNLLGSNRVMPNILRGKCVVIGDSMAGKTSIIQAFIHDTLNFQRSYSITNGIDIHTKKVSVPDTDDVVELFIYDCSGKDIYFDLVAQVLDGMSMFCIVFDVTQENSLKRCNFWIDAARKTSSHSNLPGVLIGSKVDLAKRRVTSKEDAVEFSQQNNLVYFESSALENIGIEEPFFYLVNEWHKLYLERTETFKTLS